MKLYKYLTSVEIRVIELIYKKPVAMRGEKIISAMYLGHCPNYRPVEGQFSVKFRNLFTQRKR